MRARWIFFSQSVQSWYCHQMYMHTCRKNISKPTDISNRLQFCMLWLGMKKSSMRIPFTSATFGRRNTVTTSQEFLHFNLTIFLSHILHQVEISLQHVVGSRNVGQPKSSSSRRLKRRKVWPNGRFIFDQVRFYWLPRSMRIAFGKHIILFRIVRLCGNLCLCNPVIPKASPSHPTRLGLTGLTDAAYQINDSKLDMFTENLHKHEPITNWIHT